LFISTEYTLVYELSKAQRRQKQRPHPWTQRHLQRVTRADTTRQRTRAARTTATGETRATVSGDARTTTGGERGAQRGKARGSMPLELMYVFFSLSFLFFFSTNFILFLHN
jgi:hypothetical protein